MCVCLCGTNRRRHFPLASRSHSLDVWMSKNIVCLVADVWCSTHSFVRNQFWSLTVLDIKSSFIWERFTGKYSAASNLDPRFCRVICFEPLPVPAAGMCPFQSQHHWQSPAAPLGQVRDPGQQLCPLQCVFHLFATLPFQKLRCHVTRIFLKYLKFFVRKKSLNKVHACLQGCDITLADFLEPKPTALATVISSWEFRFPFQSCRFLAKRASSMCWQKQFLRSVLSQ